MSLDIYAHRNYRPNSKVGRVIMERLTKCTHPLLNDLAISTLNQNDIFTEKDFIVFDSQRLAKISLLLFREVLQIKKYLTRKNAAVTKNAYDIYRDLLRNSALIPSGVQSIDEFLEGGFLTSNIYELCGRAASGKTLIAYIFIRNLVMELKQNCFILDAKNDFSAGKFQLLCGKYPHEDVINGLSRIFIKPIGHKYDLLNTLQEISEELEKNNCRIRLIVVDSLAAAISNSNDYSLNNLCLTHLANCMHLMITKYHIVILILNLMTTWVEGDFTSQTGTKQTISCGRFWYTIPNTRIKLEKEHGDLKLSVEKSNSLCSKTISIAFDDVKYVK